MDTKFNKPKGFGEILDHTFSLSKSRFKDFFRILLLLMGPLYLLEAIVQLASGTSFFRAVGTGGAWYEQMLSSFEETGTFDSSSLGADVGVILVGLISLILGPVAEAAILFAIDHVRKNEEYTVGTVIKQAFSRFWPMIGSSILFGLIVFAIILVPIIIITLIVVIGVEIHPVISILGAILLFLGCAVAVGLLLTRWSFYFGSVVLDKESPGMARSWRLTKKRTWPLMGLYIVFYLIISSIGFAVQMTFGIILGNSVLLSIISNIATLFTTLIFSVGYGVMYLDLKLRHDADDLKEMIDDYNLVK
ncbi:hypothetical protein ABES03_03690 [Neobacillus rhizosphaerae]|uniref:hypothetical protein n=1 Tax=Neobacillus rhizosphaerae TaxID=2880965 RepID=UPI003D26789D